MPKSAPKLKPLSTKKKKLPMMIVGLLGLALLLAGSVAAVGLMQLNQDSRSNASSSCNHISEGRARAACEEAAKKEQAARDARTDQERGVVKNKLFFPNPTTNRGSGIVKVDEAKMAEEARLKSEADRIAQQNQQKKQAAIDAQRESERAYYAKQAEQSKNDAAKEAAKAADAELAASNTTNPVEKAKYTAAATQARAKQAANEQKAAEAVAASQKSSSSGGSSNSNSKKTLGQPTNVTAICEGDKVMRIKWTMANGTADSFILAANSTAIVPGSSQCKSLMDGWRCQGDIQNEISKSAAKCNSRGECSTTISVWRTHTYDFVAVRAVMGGATKVGQKSVSLKCNK